MGLNLITENEVDCQLEKVAKKNIFVRLRLFFLFFVFLLLIFALAKNDYSLAFFGKKDLLELTCGPKNTLDSSADDQETRGEKINRAIEINQEKFSTLVGFQKIYADQEPIGYQKHMVWVAKIIFSEEDEQQKKIPDQLCGFPLKILYK